MENKIIIAFAQNLKLLIGDMSISEFARKVDIPQQTISRYLLCQREVTLTNLCKIADFFGVSVDYLLGRDNSSIPSVERSQPRIFVGDREVRDGALRVYVDDRVVEVRVLVR
jgi:transcriptional regulator with XRE-family HTH domain